MNQRKKSLKKISSSMLYSACVLLAAVVMLPLTGCAPEEKTLLLPRSAVMEETQSSDSSNDFTVKKIYTYAYETRSTLGKSAFLKGCGDNEIHTLEKESDKDKTLAYRQVDYRYGFYDTLANFFQFWESWFEPSGETFTGDLFIERLLPSPDGKQFLVYILSVFWERRIVWLYTLGEQEPLLLYEGDMESNGILKGSFSPSGRFVTFDVFGITTGSQRYVPIYNCSNAVPSTETPQRIVLENSSLLYPPDRMLHYDKSTINAPNKLLAAELYDISDEVALLSFRRDDRDIVSVEQRYWEISNSSSADDSEYSSESYSGSYLNEYAAHKMPYFKYEFCAEENSVYYLEDTSSLRKKYITTLAEENSTENSTADSMEFPNIIWDFLRLDTGDFLVVIAQDFGRNENKGSNAYVNQVTEGNTDSPLYIQNLWDIRSADLYLYPADGTEGKLLYKNLQNLLSMEYDKETRRVLLETYEDETLIKRKCIILEL